MKTAFKSAAYRALDLVTAGRGVGRTICKHRVRFPARWSRYYPAVYEPTVFAHLEAHIPPGATVLDLGAHLGLFTVVMARCVGPTGKVLSFEPTPDTRKVLERVVTLNGCGGIVEVRPEAVGGNETQFAVFFDTGDTVSNANSLVRTDRSQREVVVPTTTVDEIVAGQQRPIAYLKIDVEGAEWDVLRGAQRTFREHRPAASLALHPATLHAAGVTLDQIWQLLEDYGMSVSIGPRRIDRDEFSRQTDLFDVGLAPAN